MDLMVRKKVPSVTKLKQMRKGNDCKEEGYGSFEIEEKRPKAIEPPYSHF
jgi:hypothetical protein